MGTKSFGRGRDSFQHISPAAEQIVESFRAVWETIGMPEMANETLEGWAVLHETYRVSWKAWRELSEAVRAKLLSEAGAYLEKESKPAAGGESALYSLLGDKGDLLLLHFRKTFDELNGTRLEFRQLGLWDFLAPAGSYVSLVELGLYEMTAKTHRELLAEGLKPESAEWQARWRAVMDDQKERMKGRLFTGIPRERYFCFYPMNKRRGEKVNWYAEPMERRQQMMRDHGTIGRKYAGRVTQIITGSIGFDDWEWGVYLFAGEPVAFKKLIYEMRYDEASAWFAEFGPFWFGLRLGAGELPGFLAGRAGRSA